MTLKSREAGAVRAMSRRGFLMAGSLAGSLVCGPSLAWAAKPASGWRMWIEQAGGRTEIAPNVRLKRQPFTLVFQGPRDWGYTVMACEDPADVAGKDPLAVLTTSTNVFKIFAESADPAENTGLCVNGTGVIAADDNGMHFWSDEPEFDQHDFTRFKADPDGTARAERDVRSILIVTSANHDAETPIANTTLATISLIVAGCKASGELDFVDPVAFTIAFE